MPIKTSDFIIAPNGKQRIQSKDWIAANERVTALGCFLVGPFPKVAHRVNAGVFGFGQKLDMVKIYAGLIQTAVMQFVSLWRRSVFSLPKVLVNCLVTTVDHRSGISRFRQWAMPDIAARSSIEGEMIFNANGDLVPANKPEWLSSNVSTQGIRPRCDWGRSATTTETHTRRIWSRSSFWGAWLSLVIVRSAFSTKAMLLAADRNATLGAMNGDTFGKRHELISYTDRGLRHRAGSLARSRPFSLPKLYQIRGAYAY